MGWFDITLRAGQFRTAQKEELDWRRGSQGLIVPEGLGLNPQTSANAEGHSRFCRLTKDPELRGQSWPWGQEARGLFPLVSSSCLPCFSGTLAVSPLPPPLLSSQGLQDECQYLLQPQLIVRRLLDVAVLVPGRLSEQTLSPHNRSALYK